MTVFDHIYKTQESYPKDENSIANHMPLDCYSCLSGNKYQTCTNENEIIVYYAPYNFHLRLKEYATWSCCHC